MKDILKFSKLLEEFQKVERAGMSRAGSNRNENDVEHSYELAMLAWYLIDSKKLKLNKEKVFKYALAHDLIEAYAGDTWLFSNDHKHVKSKAKREHNARIKLQKSFSEFNELHSVIESYEQRKDKESKFVYALDKIHPMIKQLLDNGRIWKRRRFDLDELIENKTSKVGISPEIKELFDELITILRKNRKHLFHTKD